jgi:hypothetical protein
VINDSAQPDSHLTIGELYHFKAARTDGGWRLARIEVTRLWSTQPLAAAARVAQIDRGPTPVT